MKDNEKSSLKQVFDGLYIGDVDSSSNLNGLLKNRIYNVVNCASRELANSFEDLGVKYLNFYWEDNDTQVILDERDVNLNLFESFIDQAYNKRQSIAVVSYQGKCRSCVIVTAYMMRKFQWPLFQTLEFLDAKHEGLMLRQNFLLQLKELEERLYPGQVKKTISWKPPEASNHSLQSISNLAVSSSPGTVSHKNSHPTLQIDNMEPVSNIDNSDIMTFRVNSDQQDTLTLGPEHSQQNAPILIEDAVIRTRTISFGQNSFKSNPSQEDLIPTPSQVSNQVKANSEPSKGNMNNPFLVNKGLVGEGISPRFNENNIFQQAMKINMQIKPNPYPGPRVLFGSPEEVKPMDDDIKAFRHTNRGQMFNEWYKTRDAFFPKRKENDSSQSPPSRNEIDYFRATRANAFKELEEQQKMKSKIKAISNSPGGDMDRSYISKNSDTQSINSAKASLPTRTEKPIIDDESYHEMIESRLTQNQFRDRRKVTGYNRVQHRKIVGRMIAERNYDSSQKRTIEFYATPLRSNYIESAPAKNPSTDSSTYLETPSNKKKVNFTLETGSSKGMNDSIFSGKSQMKTLNYEPRVPSEPRRTNTIDHREVPGYSGFNSVSPPRERLPVISSPNKQPFNQTKMRSLYQNPENFSIIKNSTYGKLAEEAKPPEKNHGSIMNGTQIAKNAALKKKYEEMQYLENLFMKKEMNDPPRVETPKKEDFKNLIGTLYQKNFPGINLS